MIHIHCWNALTSPLEVQCAAVSRFIIIMDLLWKLPKVSRVVLILVVDHMPVRLVGLNALRRQKTQVKDHNIIFRVSVLQHTQYRKTLGYQHRMKKSICHILSRQAAETKRRSFLRTDGFALGCITDVVLKRIHIKI